MAVSKCACLRTELLIAALLAILIGGCQVAPWPFTSTTDPAKSEQSMPETTAESHPATDDKAPSKTQDAAEDKLPVAALADDRWVMTVRPMVPTDEEPQERWRHPALESTLRLPAQRRPDLTAALAHTNPIVAANAAIVLARWKAAEPVPQLVRAIQTDTLRLPLRQAAIETLGMLTSDEAVNALDGLLGEPEATDISETRLTDVPEIYAELLAARSWHVSAMADPRFVSALKSKSPLVRLEAATAWTRADTPALESTPIELLDLVTDSDTRVRIAALRAIAVHRHSRALEYLTRATKDYDVNVRLVAIAGLGELGSLEAKKSLDKLRKDPSEVARAATVGALAALGVNQAVIDAATDKSPRVRQAVADSLKQLKDDARALTDETQALARQLVQDTSSEVQRQAVAALEAWPLAQAGPVLLLAMEEGSYLTHRHAAEQLARRWPPAKDYYPDAPAERRKEQLTALRRGWDAEFGRLDTAVVRAAATELMDATGLTPEQIGQLKEWMRQLSDPQLPQEVRARLLESLEQLGPSLIATLGTWAAEDLKALPADIYTVVLPQISPTFAALERLASSDPRERRAAAAELAAQLNGKELPALALHRLAGLVEGETDPIVWQAIMAAIAGDPRQVAMRLAYIAVANSSSEVRRRACEYLQTHADPRHLAVLRPMLEDPNVTVAIAAARAIGAAGVGDPQPLVALLNATDPQLRLECAIALARAKYEAGIAAIERLSRETDLEIRRAAAVAMGEIGDPVFIPMLMLLIDDRRDIQLAAMASLAKIAGHDVGDTGDPSTLPEEKVRRWKQWCAERTATKSE